MVTLAVARYRQLGLGIGFFAFDHQLGTLDQGVGLLDSKKGKGLGSLWRGKSARKLRSPCFPSGKNNLECPILRYFGSSLGWI
jgi:hypothetical protein